MSIISITGQEYLWEEITLKSLLVLALSASQTDTLPGPLLLTLINFNPSMDK